MRHLLGNLFTRPDFRGSRSAVDTRVPVEAPNGVPAFRKLPKRREKRSATDSLKGHLSLVVGQQSGAGVPVNEVSATGVPGVLACVKLLSNLVGTLPLKLMLTTTKGSDTVTDHASALVVKQPGELHTGSELRTLMEVGKGLGGNGYCRVHRSSFGEPRELEWIAPFDVEPKYAKGQRMVSYHLRGERLPLTRYDIIHVRGFSLDGVVGISPIRMLRNAVGTSIAQSEAAGKLMKNGTNFPGYMVSPESLTPDKLKDARAEWDAHYTGATNAGRVPIMWGGWEFKQTHGMSMVDAQFLESRRFELEEIARHYQIPSFLINDTTKTTSWGTGMAEMMQSFLKICLNPILVHWEESLNFTLLTSDEIRQGLHFKFNRRALLELSPEAQAAFLQAMRGIGVYSVNDVRRRLDENELEDPSIGANYTLPFNNTGGAAQAAQSDPETLTEDPDETLTEDPDNGE